MRIVCISDTHGLHDWVDVPEGDVLVHAGDMTPRGRRDEVAAFGDWLRGLPHAHKVVIAGNHDFLFESAPDEAAGLIAGEGIHYLLDASVTIGGRVFHGSPWQPWFHGWAFNLERGAPLAMKWAAIPGETDVLVTHGPPHGVLDVVAHGGRSVGCEALTERLRQLDVSLHVFGHIHEAYGVNKEGDGRLAVNASTCTLEYRPSNAPVVVDWPVGAARPLSP